MVFWLRHLKITLNYPICDTITKRHLIAVEEVATEQRRPGFLTLSGLQWAILLNR